MFVKDVRNFNNFKTKMLVNISYKDKKITQQVNELVGNPFGLLENFKYGGIGSPRLDILKSSAEIKTLLNYDNNRDFCNIELRPKGIILRFRSILETYALIIPYYKLVFFKPDNCYTFHIDHHFITIAAPQKNKAIHIFIDKILAEKTKQTPTYIDEL
jgi:hypothetical protein